MAHRTVRIAMVLIALLAAAAGIVWMVFAPPAAPESAIPRRDMFVGVLVLGILGLAFFGHDIGDWF